MLLAVDVGNTNTVFAVCDGPRPVWTWRRSTCSESTADEYYVWLSSLAGASGGSLDIDRAVISSVVPEAVFNLRVMCGRYFGCRPLVVGKPECRIPIEARVDEGAVVGADRIVNSVGAFDRHGGDLIVVDFGTATTFDVVDSEGAYAGGVIAPGVNLSLRALHQAAAALPHVNVTRPGSVVGRNTVSCIQSGIYWGYIGLAESLCSRIKEERGTRMKVVGTGGLAPLFAQGCDLFDEIEDDLTVHGLTVIDAFNREAGDG